MKSETTILKTTDYSIFNKLNGNRPYNKGLLRSLHESIENDGDYLMYNPILVNDDMEVVDGQHRLKVAEEAGKAIYYIVGENLKLKQAQIFNSRKRQWILADFLNAYLVQGHRDAQILFDFSKEFRLSIAISVKLLAGSMSTSTMEKFRNGQFEIKDLTRAQDIAGVLSTIRDHSPDYAFAHNACIKAVFILLEKVADPKVFQRKLEQYQTVITRRVSPKDYLRQFELVLNMGSDKKEIKLL
jgi:hypothetical protein